MFVFNRKKNEWCDRKPLFPFETGCIYSFLKVNKNSNPPSMGIFAKIEP